MTTSQRVTTPRTREAPIHAGHAATDVVVRRAAVLPGEDELTVRRRDATSLVSRLPRLERHVLSLRMQATEPADIARIVGCTDMQVLRLLRGATTNLCRLLDQRVAQDLEPWT